MNRQIRSEGRNLNYRSTVRACFAAYIVQATVNNFAPLLFLTLHSQYNIPMTQITLLITINFLVQLCIDGASAFFVDRIGYRAAAVIGHVTSALGLIALAVLPGLLPSPFVGLLIAVFFYAIGGGLIEVVISPIVESCPSDHKAQTMSILHSFYCWGSAGVIIISTLFMYLFGRENWPILSVIWALLPIINGIVFLRVPLAPLIAEGETGMSLRELFSSKVFWLIMLLMMCAGASEQAVSQWASTFAEQGLGVSKAIGDLTGPTMFALLMAISRLLYGKFGYRINLEKAILASAALCIAAYLIIGLTSLPVAGLIGMAVCGFSVGIFWPGTFSTAAVALSRGGTAMFALMALAGDLGCSGGPTLAGAISAVAGDNLRLGILLCVCFPVLLIVGMLALKAALKNRD